jgi:hypothetical protein
MGNTKTVEDTYVEVAYSCIDTQTYYPRLDEGVKRIWLSKLPKWLEVKRKMGEIVQITWIRSI